MSEGVQQSIHATMAWQVELCCSIVVVLWYASAQSLLAFLCATCDAAALHNSLSGMAFLGTWLVVNASSSYRRVAVNVNGCSYGLTARLL
jgi:hypothetical protein